MNSFFYDYELDQACILYQFEYIKTDSNRMFSISNIIH